MRVRAFALRILRQMSHDKRTLALMIVAPLLLMTLVYYIFEGTNDEISIGAVGAPQQFIEAVESENDVTLTTYESRADAQQALTDGAVVAYIDIALTADDAELEAPRAYIMVDAAAGSKAQAAEKLLRSAAETMGGGAGLPSAIQPSSNSLDMGGNQPSSNLADTSDSQPSSNLPDTSDSRPSGNSLDMGSGQPSSNSLDTSKNQPSSNSFDVSVDYYKGIKNFTSFDMFGPTLMSFIVFFFVFLVAGMAFLKERKSGTLEKVISTPVRRWEIVAGYILGFGAITIVQSVIINVYIITVLGVIMNGSLGYVLLITLLEAICALSLGMLLSTAAGSEFQMMQFIPIIILPQLFFSGLFDLSEGWLIFGRIFPLTYAAEAMNKIMYYDGGIGDMWIDVVVLLGFSALFAALNVLLLKRYRRI